MLLRKKKAKSPKDEGSPQKSLDKQIIKIYATLVAGGQTVLSPQESIIAQKVFEKGYPGLMKITMQSLTPEKPSSWRVMKEVVWYLFLILGVIFGWGVYHKYF